MASTADATAQSTEPASQPSNTIDDDGLSRRPRDAHLIHLILQNLGITNYQSRVPLQLMDFAYRYTSSVLSDALRLSAEGYTAAPGSTTNTSSSNARQKGGGGGDGSGGGGGANDGSNITVSSLRQAIASRQDYQFKGALPKEFLLEQAEMRNRHVLPRIERAWGALLPDERFCLTGTGWGLKEEWESEGEDDDEGDGDEVSKVALGGPKEAENGKVVGEDNVLMGGIEEDEDEEGGKFEDVFGGDDADGNGDGDGDREMAEA